MNGAARGQDPTTGDSATVTPRVSQAIDQLRRHADQRWVEIADDVLETVLDQPRRSLPIRTSFDDGTVEVAEQVIVRHLARAFDDNLDGARLRGASLAVDRDHNLYAITIDLIATYPQPMLPTAEHARALAIDVLRNVLGDNVPTQVPIRVHYSDVQRPATPKNNTSSPSRS